MAVVRHFDYLKKLNKPNNIQTLFPETTVGFGVIMGIASRSIQDHGLGNPSNRKATKAMSDKEGLELTKCELEKVRADKVAWLKNINRQIGEALKLGLTIDDLSKTIAGYRVAANMQNAYRFNDTGERGFRSKLGEGDFDLVPAIDLSKYKNVTRLVEATRHHTSFKGAMHGELQLATEKYTGERTAKTKIDKKMKPWLEAQKANSGQANLSIVR